MLLFFLEPGMVKLLQALSRRLSPAYSTHYVTCRTITDSPVGALVVISSLKTFNNNEIITYLPLSAE